jgi:hypothetical protein
MKLFIWLFIFVALNLQARCKDLEKAADYLNSKNILKAYKGQGKEPSIKLLDVNQARAYTYKHPALDELGFGSPSANTLSDWKPYKSRLEKSSFYNKKIGYEKKLPDGSSARVRLDWDPETGGHYNIEIFKAKIDGKSENLKLKVEFDCMGKKCTQGEILKMVEKL